MAEKSLLSPLTFVDIWKAQYPDGSMDGIINETVEANVILQHAVWVKANQLNTHQGVRVATLPTSSFKRMGQGTAPTAGSHVNFTEETQVRETWIQVEDEVLQKSSNPEQYLNIQAMRGVQGIIQDSIQDLLYGNRATTPDQINGLAVRYNALQANRQLGKVISAGGATANVQTSLYGIRWGEDGVFLIYPQDHPDCGVKSQVFPAENVRDSSNRIMRVYPVRIQFAFGIGVGNRRSFFRVANLEAGATPSTAWFNATSGSGTNWTLGVENKLIEAINDSLDEGSGYRLYCNNLVKTQFDIRGKDKGNVWFSPTDPISQKPGNFTMFNQTPVYKVERIVNTEPVLV